VAVRLFSAGLDATVDGAGRDVRAVTDASGVARIRLSTSGEYVVLVNLVGFLPSTHGVRLSTGCTARVRVPLAVRTR
jgi:hypothetical protein